MDLAQYKMAFSDNSFYNQMVSTIGSSLNRGTIRRSLSGIASVIS
jgi:hypothetical protein